MKRKYIFFIFFLLAFSVFLFTLTSFAYNGDTIVYVTRFGEKYHVSTCGYLVSIVPITLEEAVSGGYTPCSRCHPPKLDGKVSVSTSSANMSEPPSAEDAEPLDDYIAVGVVLVSAGVWGGIKRKMRTTRRR